MLDRSLSRWLPLRRLAFWWTAFLVLQQGARLYLLVDVVSIEPPTVIELLGTLASGLIKDAVLASLLMGGAAMLAIPASALGQVWHHAGRQASHQAWTWSLITVAVLLAGFLILDVGYFGYSQQHLNFVFFEYVDDLLQSSDSAVGTQATQQTTAELEQAQKWMARLFGFILFETAALLALWWITGRRGPRLHLPWSMGGRILPLTGIVAAAGGVMGGGVLDQSGSVSPGLHRQADVYYRLAQNPVLFATQPWQDVFLAQRPWQPRVRLPFTTFDEAVRTAQSMLGGRFPWEPYPLVRTREGDTGIVPASPVHVVVLFVEGLDRRYIGQTALVANEDGSLHAIRLTPFLDRLRQDSLYAENFFSNGVQTARGLFSTLCSYYPRQGSAAIKTRLQRQYLCLPTVLRQAGYHTEMVVAMHSDGPNWREFLQQNGFERLYTERDFPAEATRLGIGVTDGELLSFVAGRIRALRQTSRGFLVAALTAGTHHPFIVPTDDAEVRLLTRSSDRYPAALRYFDQQFEAAVQAMKEEGLLRNTILVVLGDHGRHEEVGHAEIERQVGHFLTPLFIWIDESVGGQRTDRPRTVTMPISQVDVAPTVLSMLGLSPAVAPFVGRDVSCLFRGTCTETPVVYLSSVYDDLIGLADQDGIWLFSLRRRSFSHVDLDLSHPMTQVPLSSARVADPYRRMMALYWTSNTLLERNRLWP